MTKMGLKKSYFAMGGLVLIAAFGLTVQAQSFNPKDKGQMRQLTLDSCLKTRSEQVCNCFADKLADTFNEKDWRIFIAEQSKSSSAPSGVSEADLDSYGKKIAAAGNACGM
ncbi:MAG: hypothetical protein ACRCWR_03655 [Saezia sp.]